MNKKDTNYVAAVEKAIAEKYGKDSVQDFRSSWDPDKEKSYLQQLKQINKNGIKENNPRTNSGRSCPVCKTYSFSSKDDLYMNRFECCRACYIDFVQGESAKERWQQNWRPSSSQVEAALKRRKNNG